MIATGGCHCRAVRFEIEVAEKVDLLDCNCSICSATGHLHLIVPEAKFRLSSGADRLTSYRFGTGAAEHLFCRECGIKSYYWPRSHPGCLSVNFRCLDDGHGLEVNYIPFNGRDWEKSRDLLGD
ncbi:GFA family protein [Altererythrobacter sp. MF3-039]|uniref:GFA family protein n=1 Tax=Altererythrobacter sp. MF3-039 TaxID=3252901 RepID=UPI00390CB9CE